MAEMASGLQTIGGLYVTLMAVAYIAYEMVHASEVK